MRNQSATMINQWKNVCHAFYRSLHVFKTYEQNITLHNSLMYHIVGNKYAFEARLCNEEMVDTNELSIE